MAAFPHFLVALALLGALACGGNPAGPTVTLNEQFTLAPRETASIRETSLRLEFVRVSGDSRCPADALCVWAGDAIVHLRVTGGGSAEHELHTQAIGGHTAVVHEGFRIELVELKPYPFSSKTIEPGDYRAMLRVTR